MERPFTEKYRPSTTEDVQGHTTAVQNALEFARNYGSQKKKGLLLHGAPGVGKTSLAHAVANQLGLEVVEVNASDVRNADAIKTIMGAAMQQRSLFGSGKLIIFDEMDGLSGTKDRGGVAAIIELLKTSTYPVFLTANDVWNKKFNTLRKYCELVELKTLPYTSVLAVLKKVCESEGIMYEEDALKQLARRAGGDVRGALTDVQSLGADNMIDMSDLEVLGDRRRAESMFNALQRVFKGSDPKLARESVDNVDENLDDFFMWVDENAGREYTKGEDIARAYNALSMADVFRGRIRRWQYWRFLVYQIDNMTTGVALAKDEKYSGFTKFQRSMRPLKYWQQRGNQSKRESIGAKIASRTHTSTRQAVRDVMPFVARMIRADKKHAVVDYFELEKEEVKWLVEKAV